MQRGAKKRVPGSIKSLNLRPVLALGALSFLSISQFTEAIAGNSKLAQAEMHRAAPTLSNSVFDEPSHLIVRYRVPVDSIDQPLSLAHGQTQLSNLLSGAVAQILNVPEGIVRYEFSSPAVASIARGLLAGTDSVASISKDFLYRPAIRYEFKRAAADERLDFLGLPLSGAILGSDLNSTLLAAWGSSSLPLVNPPSGRVIYGADPLAGSDWAMTRIELPTTSLAATSHSSVIAAVVDTGFDYNHEDLSTALWRSPDNASVVGYDFAHNNAEPYDLVAFDLQGCMSNPLCASGQDTSKYLINPGHGTHCLGHLGASTNNDLGIRGAGIGVRVMAMKFFYDAGEPNAGQGDDAAAIQSIDYALSNGARVINLSWGNRMARAQGESSELKNALMRAQAAGAIVVIAAGNDGVDQDADSQPSYPAAYTLDNLIVVAATDQNDGLANFSNYGYQSVHIAAPGVKVLSTTVGSHYSDVVARANNAQGQPMEMDWNGTSMSAPLVAGAVATVWAQYPAENYHQIRNRILKSARIVPNLAGRVATSGILNVQAALTLSQ